LLISDVKRQGIAVSIEKDVLFERQLWDRAVLSEAIVLLICFDDNYIIFNSPLKIIQLIKKTVRK